MKLTSAAATFFTLFLLSAITSASIDKDFIKDSDGNPLESSRTYYILPTGLGWGGLTLGKTGDETCEVSVVQSRTLHRGIPVGIKSKRFGTPYIYDGDNVTISFTEMPDCALTSKWALVNFGSTRGLFVKLRGTYERYEVEGSFQITAHRIGSGNKIRFSTAASSLTLDIVVHVTSNGIRELVATRHETPLAVKFVRAHPSREYI